MEEQVVTIYAATPAEGRDSWVRPYELQDIGRYESEMLEYMRSRHPEVLESIRTSSQLDDETEAKLVAALDGFAKVFRPTTGGTDAEEAAA